MLLTAPKNELHSREEKWGFGTVTQWADMEIGDNLHIHGAKKKRRAATIEYRCDDGKKTVIWGALLLSSRSW